MAFGGRLSAGAGTEGYGALGPSVAVGVGTFRESRDYGEKQRLIEEERRREAANDELRRRIEEARLRQADERIEQTDRRLSSTEERAEADRKAREARDAAAAEERRIGNERADKRLGLSEDAAGRSAASLAGVESRFSASEARRDRERREDAERNQRTEARIVANERHEAAQDEYRNGLRDEAPPSFESLFDEELVIRGLAPMRQRPATGSPTPVTTAPAGAPKPPPETPRVPAKPLGGIGAAAKASPSTEEMPESVRALAGGNAIAVAKALKLARGGMPWDDIERLLREAIAGR